MAEAPKKQSAEARDFPGLELQTDAHDVEPGKAQDQVNAQSDQAGALRVRLGVLPVSFEA